MKIIHIVGSLDTSAGGPSRSVPQTCIELAKLGVEIELIARPSKNPVNIPEISNLKVYYKSIRELFKYGGTILTKDVDLIHLQHVWDPYIHIMAFWAKRKNIPYIITPRGMLEPWILNRNPWKKKLGMLLYQKNDLKKAFAIHATCELEKNNIRRLGFLNPIKIIPNGVDISKFPSSVPGKKSNPKKILFLSRIHLKKGIEFLIEAWFQLDIKLRKKWVIEIIGNGDEDYIDFLKEKIKKLNLEKEILIKNPVFGKEKIKVFREASLFVLPTYSENFGIVVAEALASYTPVITTTGTPWEELNTESCGWWIPVGVEPLKKTLEDALAKTEIEILEMGKRGRKLIVNKYKIEQVGKQMMEFYKKNVKV